jgi:OHCU decarboxylase
MTLDDLNTLPAADAEAALLRCCGSRAWAARMCASRPFPSREALDSAADRIWSSLGPDDWREAFAAHPRIGQPVEGSRPDSDWSATEQSSMSSASDVTRSDLASVNAAYEARFGYIFIVCATGRSADEILTLARQRLENAPHTEITVAAAEQAAITRLRLDKLLES